MAITEGDLERWVRVHELVRTALERDQPRVAGRLLCSQFKELLAKESFWKDVRDATQTLAQHTENAKQALSNIASFLDNESRVLSDLGIDPSRSTPILRNVFDKLSTAGGENPDAPLFKRDLEKLRKDLRKATNLICKASQGPVQRAREWLMTWKGVAVLAGAIVVAVNVYYFAHSGDVTISLASIRVGTKVMKRDVDGIIDVLGEFFKTKGD